jgi:polar amino acid transport system substrate-binding protein
MRGVKFSRPRSLLQLTATVSFLVLSCSALLQAKVPATIVVGINNESYPPLYWKTADGRWVGWEMDLLHATCARLKATCIEREFAWDGLIPALESKHIDVIWASLSITEDRARVIDFTHFYYDTPIIIIGPRDEPLRVRCDDLATLGGYAIGAEAGSTLARFLLVNAPKSVKVKVYDTMDNVLADLTIGRLDFALEGGSTLAMFLNQNPEFEPKSTCPPDRSFGAGIGGGIRKDDRELKARLSAAILGLSADGTWDRITAQYPEISRFLIKP